MDGISSKIREKLGQAKERAKEYPKEKYSEYKENRQYEKGVKADAKVEWRKGYSEGAKKGAYERGKAVGSGRTTQGVTGSIGAFGMGINKGIKNYNNIFGVSSGFGLGFGPEPVKKSQPPQRVTTYNPKSGSFKVTETIQPNKPAEKPWDPWGLDTGSSRTSKGVKKEKHPYDPF